MFCCYVFVAVFGKAALFLLSMSIHSSKYVKDVRRMSLLISLSFKYFAEQIATAPMEKCAPNAVFGFNRTKRLLVAKYYINTLLLVNQSINKTLKNR